MRPNAVRPQRSDARANRERLLDAAGEVFAEQGVVAPMAVVAHRAGVGVGTLYRHFADRGALVHALGARVTDRTADVASSAAGAPSGWDAILSFVDGLTTMYLDYPWLVQVRARVSEIQPDDDRIEAAVTTIVERAWAEGTLRLDVSATDLVFVPSLLSGLVHLPEPTRSAVMVRQRDIILDGLRAEGLPRHAPGGEPFPLETLLAHASPAVAGR
ncbi:MAG TPA: TetR/AcrR family transcriptional regulator [Microbacterium sp.]|nr:TetR/AcrR family transcriptional regulator [Microbacterium sp.]